MKFSILFCLCAFPLLIFSQIQNDSIRLDSIQYQRCYRAKGDCFIENVSLFFNNNDTIVKLKKEVVYLNGMQEKEEYKYLFDEQKRLRFLDHLSNGKSHQTFWNFNGDGLIRKDEKFINPDNPMLSNEWQYVYDLGMLRQIDFRNNKGRSMKDTVIYDRHKRIIFRGNSYDQDLKSLGVHYTYDSDLVRLPNSCLLYSGSTYGSTIYRAKYDSKHRLIYYSHGMIYHNDNEREGIFVESNFTYDSSGFLTEIYLSQEDRYTKIIYKYNIEGKLIETHKTTMKKGKKTEEIKISFEYLEKNGILYSQQYSTIIREDIISNLDHFPIYYDMQIYYLGIIQNSISNLKEIPAKIIVENKNLIENEWFQPNQYIFHFSN